MRLGERHADAVAEELVGDLLVQLLRRVEERTALLGEGLEVEAEPLVELEVVRCAELAHRVPHGGVCLEVDRVQMLLDELVARALEPFALRPLGCVRDRRPDHPKADLLAVDRRLQLGFEPRDLLLVLLRQLPEIALAGEAPELADAVAAVDGLADRAGLLERRQVGVPVVDRHEVECLLQAGEVEVVLLVELGDEAIDALAVLVELSWRTRPSGS